VYGFCNNPVKFFEIEDPADGYRQQGTLIEEAEKIYSEIEKLSTKG
jgi:hypothetical protein